MDGFLIVEPATKTTDRILDLDGVPWCGCHRSRMSLRTIQGRSFWACADRAGGSYRRYVGNIPWKILRRSILERDNHICAYCGRTGASVVDHVAPKLAGGPDEEWNLVAACKPCNGAKIVADKIGKSVEWVLSKLG